MHRREIAVKVKIYIKIIREKYSYLPIDRYETDSDKSENRRM